MFDGIGVSQDEAFAVRQAKATGLALVLAALGLGGVVVAGLWSAGRAVPVPGLPDDPADFIAYEVPDDPGVLEVPDPPPLARLLRGAREAEPDTTPEMPDQPSDVADLADEVSPEVADGSPDVGDPDGAPDGVVDGDPDGQPGGDPDGRPGGRIGGQSGPRWVHHRDAEVKRRVQPAYPAAARGMALGKQTCEVRLSVNDAGVPTAVEVTRCPKVFHETTEEALLGWRWYPLREDGQRFAFRTRMLVTYQETP